MFHWAAATMLSERLSRVVGNEKRKEGMATHCFAADQVVRILLGLDATQLNNYTNLAPNFSFSTACSGRGICDCVWRNHICLFHSSPQLKIKEHRKNPSSNMWFVLTKGGLSRWLVSALRAKESEWTQSGWISCFLVCFIWLHFWHHGLCLCENNWTRKNMFINPWNSRCCFRNVIKIVEIVRVSSSFFGRKPLQNLNMLQCKRCREFPALMFFAWVRSLNQPKTVIQISKA